MQKYTQCFINPFGNFIEVETFPYHRSTNVPTHEWVTKHYYF